MRQRNGSFRVRLAESSLLRFLNAVGVHGRQGCRRSNMSEPNKIIFSMVKVSKFYDKKPVLKDIYLSFFYGAKIGVLGLNGAGKSSLLRIIAGTEKDFNGEGVFSKGYSVGYLEQEPKLDETKTVQQIVEEAVQSTV